MDLMESLLCPQISMDVDDTPLQLNNSIQSSSKSTLNDSDDEAEQVSDDHKVKMLLDLDHFDPAQTPMKLTAEELSLKENLFKIGPEIQFMKIHCTACYIHLGSAPINQFERYIHPMMNVLLCKHCYEFYCSGEFEKDEDGSEMYCRWCGQGGKVMCCSDCSFVFCEKCVRQNLGRRTLDLIRDSDDWRCFACQPSQLMNLKLVCETLYHYTRDTIRLAKEINDFDLLKKDESTCCSKNSKPSPQVKRKRVSVRQEDETYDPDKDILEIKRKRKLEKPVPMQSLAKSITSGWAVPQQNQNKVVCTPDLPMLLKSNQNASTTTQAKNDSNVPLLSKYLRVKILPKQNEPPRKHIPIAPKLTPKPPIIINASTSKPLTATLVKNRNKNALPTQGTQNFIPLPTPQRVTTNTKSMNKPLISSVPAKLAPGLKHNWFEQSQTITTTITNNLTRRLAGLTIEQKNARTIEQLANIHNRLQELLSSSVNSLIQVRKNLRAEFLNDLNKLKFADSPQTITTFPMTINNPPPLMEINKNKAPTQEDDDDDVIIINEDPLADVPNQPQAQVTPQATPVVSKGFLKVKSVASLQAAVSKLFNGVPEEINLCDDDDEEDDDYHPMLQVEAVLNDCGDDDIIEDTTQIDASKIIEEKADAIIAKDDAIIKDEIKEKDRIEEEPALPDVDEETYLQIQRALAESKFESIMEANSKVRVDDSIAPVELKRILSVRVCLDSKNPSVCSEPAPIEEVEEQDFEEMLCGSVVVNKAKTKFDDAFSKFLNTNKHVDTDLSDVDDESDNEKSHFDDKSGNYVSKNDKKCLDSGNDKTDNDKSDNDKTDNDKSDNDKTDNDKSDYDKTDNDKSDYDKTDIDKSYYDKTDNDKSDYDKTDIDKSDYDKTNNVKSDNVKTDNVESDYDKTDNDKSDYDKTDNLKSDYDKTGNDKSKIDKKSLESDNDKSLDAKKRNSNEKIIENGNLSNSIDETVKEFDSNPSKLDTSIEEMITEATNNIISSGKNKLNESINQTHTEIEIEKKTLTTDESSDDEIEDHAAIIKALAAVEDSEDEQMDDAKLGHSDVDEDDKMEEERSDGLKSVQELTKSDITTDPITTTDSGIEVDGK